MTKQHKLCGDYVNCVNLNIMTGLDKLKLLVSLMQTKIEIKDEDLPPTP